MKILYLTQEPLGAVTAAAIIRMNLEVAGLAKAGHSVQIVSFDKGYRNPPGFAGRVIRKLDRIFFRKIRQRFKLKKIRWADMVCLCESVPNDSHVFVKICAANKKYCIVRNEYPMAVRTGKGKVDLSHYKNANGFITCSDALNKYYRQFTGEQTRFLTPYIYPVDYKMFANETLPCPEIAGDYIVYCGYMGSNKDGVDNLIDSFILTAKQISDVKLVLIGRGTDEDLARFKKKISAENLEQRVIFTGILPREAIPAYLKHAVMCVLHRPANKQAEGGIPSKLLEYMASGTPVIVTDVGEISRYVTDGVNGYLLEAGNIKMFSDKMLWILHNREEARAVGLEGQKTAKNQDYTIEGKRLGDFFKKVLNDS